MSKRKCKITPINENYMIEWRKEFLMKKRERLNNDQKHIQNQVNSDLKTSEPPNKRKANANNSIKK